MIVASNILTLSKKELVRKDPTIFMIMSENRYDVLWSNRACHQKMHNQDHCTLLFYIFLCFWWDLLVYLPEMLCFFVYFLDLKRKNHYRSNNYRRCKDLFHQYFRYISVWSTYNLLIQGRLDMNFCNRVRDQDQWNHDLL